MQTLFTVTLIVELVFALGFIAVPGPLFGTFGVVPNAFGISLARLFGSALLAFCTLLWYARGSKSTDLQKATIRSLFLYWLVSSFFLITAQLAGLFNTMGWSTILMHLGFLIWYGTYAFKK
ncbi:MAG: hypothetical protein E4H33_00730 [Anaerolineales bacterium]|nr:MAG: hypothetical protein E4H33_00730 [Anaerolineales bacterium]